MSEPALPPADARRPSVIPGWLVMTGFLSAVWLGFSDKYDLFHLSAGLLSAAAVAAASHSLLVAGVRRTRRGRRVYYYFWSFRWHRLVIFLPWLVWKIASANLHVTRMVLHPRMPIDPALIRFSTNLHSDLARLALAATITLTPGTCVVDVDRDVFTVHKLHPASASDIDSGAMIEMVRKTFELDGIETGGSLA